MKKIDLLAAFIIGEAVALISLPILRFLELPALIIKIAKYFPVILPLFSIFGIYIAWLISKKIGVIFQVAKCFLVGILNTLIDFGILNLLMGIFGIFAGWPYSIFKAISFSTSVINSYFWNKFWTFKKRETAVGSREFSRFYFIALGGLLIHVSVASLVVNIVGPQFGLSEKIWANIGALVAVFCGFTWNFLGYKFIVFKK